MTTEERPHISVASIVDRALSLYPDREAIVWQDTRLSYADLGAATDVIAARLEDAGLASPERVALLGRNNVGAAVGLLALARHGFEAVPLNWRFSDRALAGTAAKYGPRAVLHTAEYAETAARLAGDLGSGIAVIQLDDDAVLRPDHRIAERFSGRRHEPLRSEIFAYISTGGTEGIPKGVPVTQGMVEASVVAQLMTEEILETDSSLILPQLFHNPHLYVIPPLLTGGKLVIPDMPSFDAELVLRTIEAEGVTRFLGVATMMAYLLDAQDRIGVDVSTLRTISYGGAPFAARTVVRLMETFQCGLLQLYGQTEASVLISTLRPEHHRKAVSAPEFEYLLTSAGRPVPLVEIDIRDEAGRTCPRDGETVGEITYRSPSAMAGYFEDPEKTAETVLEGGWVRSGDLGVWDEDGWVYIVDRRGDMIISGGENVYPSAVEDVIREVEGVEDVVVIGTPDETWGEVVTAVVACREGATVTQEMIAGACDEALAGYMRPRIFHFVDELPKNPSGKIMRGEVRTRYASPASGSGKLGRV